MKLSLYVNELQEYMDERSGLMWDLESLPFAKAKDDEELCRAIAQFDGTAYESRTAAFLSDLGVLEDGKASQRAADLIERRLGGDGEK